MKSIQFACLFQLLKINFKVLSLNQTLLAHFILHIRNGTIVGQTKERNLSIYLKRFQIYIRVHSTL